MRTHHCARAYDRDLFFVVLPASLLNSATSAQMNMHKHRAKWMSLVTGKRKRARDTTLCCWNEKKEKKKKTQKNNLVTTFKLKKVSILSLTYNNNNHIECKAQNRSEILFISASVGRSLRWFPQRNTECRWRRQENCVTNAWQGAKQCATPGSKCNDTVVYPRFQMYSTKIYACTYCLATILHNLLPSRNALQSHSLRSVSVSRGPCPSHTPLITLDLCELAVVHNAQNIYQNQCIRPRGRDQLIHI